MKLTLENKTILSTGGLGALAESILTTLSAAGAKLVVTDRQLESAARPVLEAWGLGGTLTWQWT